MFALSACSESSLSPPSPIAGPSRSISSVPSDEQARVNDLTRSIALALSNSGLRNQLRIDLRDSRHTKEHKLELRSYLKGQNGGLLLAQMARVTGATRDSLMVLVNGVRPLEFYMPVAAHRESWSGGQDLLVASQLAEKDIPVGYDLAGQAVQLSLSQPPSTPTLTLVPIETDFASPLDATRYVNTNAKGGTTIGTFALIDPCSDPTAPGCQSGTNPPGIPDAAYLTALNLADVHEPWTKGVPELEFHVHGPQSKDYPLYGEDLSCAGELAPGTQYWDQNANNWSAPIGAGAPLIMSRYNINNFQARFPGEAVHYLIWEDDNAACKTVTDKDMKTILATSIGQAAGAGNLARRGGPLAVVGAVAFSFTVSLITNGASLLLGNDDYVGALIAVKGTPDEALYPNMTHVVKDGGTAVGSARIEFVWPTTAAASVTPSAPSVALNQYQSTTLSAIVRDQYGSTMSGHPISWRSDNTNIARIDDNGSIYGANAGSTTLYVRACDPDCIDGPVSVTVRPDVLPLSVTTSGPTVVTGCPCTWTATATGGTAPYSYQWTGVLFGTGPSISGTPSSSGSLNLTVTDAAGRTASSSRFVSVY